MRTSSSAGRQAQKHSVLLRRAYLTLEASARLRSPYGDTPRFCACLPAEAEGRSGETANNTWFLGPMASAPSIEAVLTPLRRVSPPLLRGGRLAGHPRGPAKAGPLRCPPRRKGISPWGWRLIGSPLAGWPLRRLCALRAPGGAGASPP